MFLGFDDLEEFLRFKVDSDERVLSQSFKTDSGQFLQRELTKVEQKVIEYIPPSFSSRQAWHVNNEGSGLESIEFETLVRSGMAEFTNDKTTEIPYADFSVGSNPSPVRNLAIGYKWSHSDMLKSIQAKRPLKDQKAKAAKEGTEARFNQVAWYGDKTVGVKGFFSYLQEMNLITPVNNAGATSTKWINKTSKEIYMDVQKLIRASDIATNGSFESNVLAVGVEQHALLHDTHMNEDVMSPTIAQRILGSTSITKIIKAPELKNVTAKVGNRTINGEDVAVAFNDREDVFCLQHAVEFTTLPMQVYLFMYVVPCYADTAGLFYYRSNCASYLTGV